MDRPFEFGFNISTLILSIPCMAIATYPMVVFVLLMRFYRKAALRMLECMLHTPPHYRLHVTRTRKQKKKKNAKRK